MAEQLLKDPDLKITDALLERECGAFYPVLREFLERAVSEAFSLSPEWRYYKDGQAWLCKLSRKKKTVVWLSLWQSGFKLGLYFTEKTGAGIEDLAIGDDLKRCYRQSKPIGKLKPLEIDVSDRAQLDDVWVLLRYKSSLV